MRDKKIDFKVTEVEKKIILRSMPPQYESLSEYIRDTLLYKNNVALPAILKVELNEIQTQLKEVLQLMSSLLNNKSTSKPTLSNDIIKSIIEFWSSEPETLLSIKSYDELLKYHKYDFQKKFVPDAIEKLISEDKLILTKSDKLRWI